MINEKSLIKHTEAAHKTYSFFNEGNPRMISDYWFQESHEGKIFFIVFYTQACRYSKCLGCNLPSLMSQHHIDFKNIMRQIDAVFHNILSETQKQEINKIIVSNNGSILDEDTFSTTALIYLLAKTRLECPAVNLISLETRTEYVDIEELEVLARALTEGDNPVSLEISIGVEVFDDTIRNKIFHKGLNLDQIDSLASKIAEINTKFSKNFPDRYENMRLKTYFMQKPVSQMTEQEGIQDIKNGIYYLDELSQKHNIDINMHLNPTYVASGTILEKEFLAGKYSPPLLESIVKSVLHAENKNITVYVGLNDEGLAVENGSFIRKGNTEDARLIERLDEFNKTQNFKILQ